MGIATHGYISALQEEARKRSSGKNEPFYPKHFPKQNAADLSAKLRESNSSRQALKTKAESKD